MMIVTRGMGEAQCLVTRGFGEIVESVIAEIYRRFRGGRRILIGKRTIQQTLPIGPGPTDQHLYPIRSSRSVGPVSFMRSLSIRRRMKIR